MWEKSGSQGQRGREIERERRESRGRAMEGDLP